MNMKERKENNSPDAINLSSGSLVNRRVEGLIRRISAGVREQEAEKDEAAVQSLSTPEGPCGAAFVFELTLLQHQFTFCESTETSLHDSKAFHCVVTYLCPMKTQVGPSYVAESRVCCFSDADSVETTAGLTQ